MKTNKVLMSIAITLIAISAYAQRMTRTEVIRLDNGNSSAPSFQTVSLGAPDSLFQQNGTLGAAGFNYNLSFPKLAPSVTNFGGAGFTRGILYSDSTGQLGWQGVPTNSNIVTGAGTATRLAFWNSASDLTSDITLNWDNATNTLVLGSNTAGSEDQGAISFTNGNSTTPFTTTIASSSTQSATQNYTLPLTGPTTDGQVLTTTSAGQWSWSTQLTSTATATSINSSGTGTTNIGNNTGPSVTNITGTTNITGVTTNIGTVDNGATESTINIGYTGGGGSSTTNINGIVNIPGLAGFWGFAGNAVTATDVIGTSNAQDLRIVTGGTAAANQRLVISGTTGIVNVQNGGLNLNGASVPLQLNGSAGTAGQVMTSAGAGTTPTWSTSLSSTATTSTIESGDVNINATNTGGTIDIGNATSTTTFLGTVVFGTLPSFIKRGTATIGATATSAAVSVTIANPTTARIVVTYRAPSAGDFMSLNVTGVSGTGFTINSSGPGAPSDIDWVVIDQP